MAELSEIAAVVRLLRAGRMPPWQIADLVEEAGSARAALEGESPAQQALFDGGGLDEICTEILSWQRKGMRLVTVLDEGYPDSLRAVWDRPPLLFVDGCLHDADGRSVAVVGARVASRAGLAAASRLAGALVDAGFTVISGLAAGIDTAAHEAVLRRGGRTVAVIGTGLGRFYPASNAGLQRRIAAGGAVVSQFWPSAPPTRESFPKRNAVMSGLALGSVIVEASVRSGTRVLARRALAHGRPVFLLESLLAQEWARALAARPGCYVVRDPGELVSGVQRLTATDVLTA